VTAGALPAALDQATVVLVAVQDDQLDAALAELTLGKMAPGAVVLHLSGSRDPEGLTALRALGHPCGTFHPLVPLAHPEVASSVLRGAWIGVDGDPAAVAAAERLATTLEASTLRIPPGEKARYHAAAVFASNFPAVLAAVAERLLLESGVEPVAARGATLTLLGGAIENLAHGAPAESLTGPVRRGDVEAIRAHLAALRGDPVASAAYRALGRAAVDVMRAGGMSSSHRLADVATLLDAPD
jgi:predicted short-subunit dehydrogenase-like oxidoreductase (DUF2520 family)